MAILTRYIHWNILKGIAMVGLVLAGILLFVSLVSELTMLGGAYGLWQACGYALAKLPYQWLGLFPLIALIGTLLGLGLLARTGELLAMRTTGMRTMKLMYIVLQIGLGLGLVVILVGESVVLSWLHHAENKKLYLVANGQALRTLQGVWLKDKNDYIYIGQYDGERVIKQVTRFHFDEHYVLVSITQAQQGLLQQGYWRMQHIQTSYLHPNQVTTDIQQEQVWPLNIPPSLLLLSKIYPEELSLVELYTYMQEQAQNQTQAGIYALIFWQRLMQPLQTVLMMLLAVSCVLGPLRSSRLGVKIVIGMVLGFSFFILNRLLGLASLILQISPLWAMLLSLILWLSAWGCLLRRV